MSVNGRMRRDIFHRRLQTTWRIVVNIRRALRLLERRQRGGTAWAIRWSPGRVAGGTVLIVAAIVWLIVLFDSKAIELARELPNPVVWAFEQITDYGLSGWFLWPLGALLAAIAAAPASLPKPVMLVLTTLIVRVGFLFLAIGTPSLFTGVVKRMIGRHRPFTESPPDPFISVPFIWRSTYASFPSGHATTAFAAAAAIGVLWPRARPAMLTYAIVVAVSRVVVTAHYPSDVIAGAVVGWVGAILIRDFYASRRRGFAVTMSGAVRPMPGPSWQRLKAAGRVLLA